MNLEKETICGYEVPAEMKRLWAMELDIVKQFVAVCNKYHLKYWIMGGTLLGAVRHKGFIPWDNDMDLAMPRKDFDKLLEIGPEAFQSPLFFQTPETEHSRFFRAYVRIRNGNGTASFQDEYNLGINGGVFVDIFCLDEIPESSFKRKCYFRKINEIAKMARFSLRRHLKGGLVNNIEHSIQKFAYYIVLRKPNTAQLFNLYQKEAGRYAGQGHHSLAHQAFGYNPHYVWEAKDWEETVMLPFEDAMLCAPKGYDAILRHQYGDYMQIPEDKATHDVYHFDPDVPYTEYFGRK